jgi:predicted MFS family arabinose efflux permease
MTAMIFGGWLGETIGWRWTLVWMGAPGLVLALLVRFTVREPTRGAVDPAGVDTKLYDWRATVSFLWRLRSYRHLALGSAFSVFAGSSLMTWGPAFLMRTHEMGVAQAGRSLGPLAGIGGACGVLLGGFVAQRLLRRDASWLLRVPMLANFLCVPFIVLFLLLPTPAAALLAYAGAAILTSVMMGPAMTAVQALAKVRMRAVASALVSLTVNLLGVGLGAFAVGAASDALRSTFGASSLRYALLLTAVASLLSGVHFALGTRHLRTELPHESAKGTTS